MATACFGRRVTSVPAQVLTSVQAIMVQISHIFPHSSLLCIVNSVGEVIAYVAEDITDAARVLELTSAVKQAALLFAETHSLCSVPVLHIKGQTHILSCFDISNYVFGMCLDMHPAALEMFDTRGAETMLRPFLEDVTRLLEDF
eukprot:GILK01008326.1.p1 GENE.GILK01008326.1~~GILK01008326.1.p1  ORF type:complete len:144 (-),score=4.38 GILK01008326.1:506-937(-)